MVTNREIAPQNGALNRSLLSSKAKGQLAEGDFSAQFLTLVLSHWWKILIPTTILCLAASIALVMYLFEPKYQARAALRITDIEPYVAFSHGSAQDRHNAEKYVKTQMELLRSRPILEMVMANTKIARMEEIAKRKDAIEWLATKALVIEPRGDSELLEVSYAGPDPVASAELVNAVIDSYFSLRKERSDEQTRRIADLLDAEKTRREKTISVLQAEIRELEQQLVKKDPSLITSAIGDANIIISESPLRGIQKSMVDAQVQKNILEAEITALNEAVQREPIVPEFLVSRSINESQQIQENHARINQKKIMIAEITELSANGEEDPACEKLRGEIETLLAANESIRETYRPQLIDDLKAQARLNQQQKLDDLTTKLATQDLIVQSLTTNYQQHIREAGLSGGQTLDLRVKRDDLARDKAVYDMIAQRTTELRTEMNAPNRVTPLYMAKPATLPLESFPLKYLALALVGSLFVPFGIAIGWERSINRIGTANQLKHRSHIPIVGEIARLPAKHGERNGHSKFAMGVFEESVDSLRTGLFLTHDKDDFQVLAVASAVSGEGKSSVASQLAVSLARATSKPTLLIDGDMRSPNAHQIFKISNEIGLSNVLEGTATVEEAINTSWSEHVHILPAGRLTKSPHKLFGTGEFKRLLDEVRLWYRYVVIDTPPILAASESLVMNRDADATLVCVMQDVSRENHIQMAYDKLTSTGARPIGAVLNGVPTRTYARRYGSYDYAH